MKSVRWLAAVVCVLGLAMTAQAGLSVGGKLWYVSFGDDELDSAILIGPKLEISGETFWLSGMFLFGSAEVSEGGVTEDIDLQDGEALIGASFQLLDIGVGIRDTTLRFRGDDMTIWGPMAYIGLGGPFGETPFGWYIGGSYMFMDLGDLKDLQDDIEEMGGDADITGEHYNIEGGVSFGMERFQATLGYRMKKFLNWDDKDENGDLTQSGLAASASFTF
jgi:hypothetical protein